MKAFILIILGIGHLHTVSAVTHSLKYYYTGVSGETNLPEFTTVGLVNNVQFIYFDSNTKTAVPKTEWMKREGPDYWDSQTQTGNDLHQVFKNNIQVAKGRFNQSTGVHVLQWMYGCVWDDETGVIQGFDQYGYDGEDFISFDKKTLSWIAPKPQAVITKNKWDGDKAGNEYLNNYVTSECIVWLKKYLEYGNSNLMRTVAPAVSLLQKTPSSPVTCHATGFYPSRVMVTWKKDGLEQHVDVEVGETLQNDDGTFQKSVHLTVKPEEWKNHKYQCVVQVSGINEDLIKDLTENKIGPDWGKTNKDTNSIGLLTGVVVAVLLLIVAAVIILKKKSKKGFAQANTSDTDSVRELARRFNSSKCIFLNS